MQRPVVALLAIAASTLANVDAMPICNAYKGTVYEPAKLAFPELKNAIETVQEHGAVPWYTDNMDVSVRDNILSTLSSGCAADTKVPLVVYGIPNKDCDAGYSNAGSNKNFDDYKAFIGKLTSTFPTQNMIYIIEPDAVGLTATGGCGIDSEYPKYLKYVLEALSANPNAELYLDIGFWTLLPSGNPAGLAKVVNDIWPTNGRVKGITLNTSNYQKTADMIQLCESFATITGKLDMKCIIDTSRNNKGPSLKGEWCNVKNTGIGVPPTQDTGNARAAYFLWVKPPGESDGTCDAQTSGDSLIGPSAGSFFKEHFEMLWNNGYFVENGIAKPVGGSLSTPPTPAPTSAEGVPTPAPTSTETTPTPAPTSTSSMPAPAPTSAESVPPPSNETPAPSSTEPIVDPSTHSPTMVPSPATPTPAPTST